MECPNCGKRVLTYSQRCGNCRATIPPGQYLLEESGVVERSAPITTAPALLWQSPTRRTASLGDRLIAAILDSMVVLGAVTVISAWSFQRWGISNGGEFRLSGASLSMAGTLSA